MSFTPQFKPENGSIAPAFLTSNNTSRIRLSEWILNGDLPPNLFYGLLREDWTNTIRTSRIPQWPPNPGGPLEKTGPQKQQATGGPSDQRFVLHVEDDEEDQMLLEEALTKLDSNIKVWQAESGKEALSFLNQCKELHKLPCLIILDINLPGMNGKEVLKEIKKDQVLASLPLVIFTTASDTAYKDLIKKENVVFLTKPSSPAELIDSATRMLGHCPPM